MVSSLQKIFQSLVIKGSVTELYELVQSIVRDSTSEQLANIKEVIVLVMTSSENKKESLVNLFGP